MKTGTVTAGMKLGAAVGGLVFLLLGIVPGFYFGSFGTLVLLQKLTGSPVEPALVVRVAMIMGSGIGVVCAATVSIMAGGLLGAAMGFAASALGAFLGRREAGIRT